MADAEPAVPVPGAGLPGEFASWPAFYAALTAGGEIGFRPVTDYRKAAAIVSGLAVSLSEVMTKAFADGHAPNVITIFADVLSVDVAEISLKGSAIFIAARRIEGSADSLTIKFPGSATSALAAVIAQSVDRPLSVTVEAGGVSRPLALPSMAGIGQSFTLGNGAATVTDIDAIHGSYDWATPHRRSLTMVLQYGAAAFDGYPVVAGDMFTYVVKATRGIEAAADLHDQAVSLLATLNASTSSVVNVPALDRAVYEEEARAFAAASLAHDAARQQFLNAGADAKARADAAKLMQARYRDTAGFNETLLAQAKSNLLEAQKAAITAYFAADEAQHDSRVAADHFKVEADIWAERQKVQAAFQIILSIVEVAGAVALTAAGDVGAEKAAFKEAQELKTAAEDVKKVAEAVEAFKTMGTNAKKLESTLNAISRAAEAMSTLSKLIISINEMSHSADGADIPRISFPASGLQSTDPQWDIFVLDFDSMISPALSAGIPGASDYQLAVHKLAVYAKAAMAVQGAAISAAQDVFRLTLQARMDRAQEARITQYIGALATDQEAADALAQIFLARELSMRISFFIAVRGYAAAYRYWALKRSRVTPSITTPVSDLMSDLAAISREYDEALQNFNPPPQKLGNVVRTIRAGDKGPFAGVVEALKSGRRANVAIPLTDPGFSGYGRVRLSAIRVWLEGVDSSQDAAVTVDIASSAQFEDRRAGVVQRFTSVPVRRSFRYAGAVRSDAAIQLDGLVEDRERFRYFQPTPFSQWELSVPEDVDLSNLTAILLEFQGSAIRELTH
jgi:tetratricopeptide (TPR) repeat protein